MKLEVLPLDQKTFSAYGDVIETQERDFFHINNGLVERYHDLAKVEVLEQESKPRLNGIELQGKNNET